MKKSIIFCWLLVLVLTVPASAELLRPWTDVWTNAAYYNTNFERSSFATYLLRSQGKVGIHLLPIGSVATLDPYFVYELDYSPDPNYWNNRLRSGIGARFKPFAVKVNPELINEIKIFYESVSASYLKDSASAEATGRSPQDSAFGLDLWYEWNQPANSGDTDFDFGSPWAEVWANLAFRQTNNYINNFNSYILQIQPKVGWYFGGTKEAPPTIEPYLKSDITLSGRDYYWLNRIIYGLGFRAQPFRYVDEDVMPALFKFKMFFEVLGVTYFRSQPTTPVGMDLRLGVDLTIGR